MVAESVNQFQLTIATIIGLVAHVAWRQTSFLKGLAIRGDAWPPVSMAYRGDVDSPVVMGMPSYGQDITRVGCGNLTLKCYGNRLEVL